MKLLDIIRGQSIPIHYQSTVVIWIWIQIKKFLKEFATAVLIKTNALPLHQTATAGGEGRGISWRPPAYSLLNTFTNSTAQIHAINSRGTCTNLFQTYISLPFKRNTLYNLNELPLSETNERERSLFSKQSYQKSNRPSTLVPM